MEGETDLARHVRKLGESQAASRFLQSYGKKGVRALYAYNLSRYYYRWLRTEKEIDLGLDGLIRDNLVCVFRSDPVDVDTKRKHRAWLEEYINVGMAGRSESYRRGIASIIKGFYEKNDSPLFGSIRVADSEAQAPARALEADEIRKVLNALPLQQRTPLLCMWQSGVEISRVLALRWADLEGIDGGLGPLKLQFYGRKRHKRPYYTFLGRDSMEALKLWREKWAELVKRQPSPQDLVFLGKRGGGLECLGEWIDDKGTRNAHAISSAVHVVFDLG